MKNLILIAGLLTLVSCTNNDKVKDWVKDCASAQIAGASCDKAPPTEPPVTEPPVVEPPVVQISMDNIQAVWFEGNEVTFDHAAQQGTAFYTEFKVFPSGGGEVILSFFDYGTVWVTKYDGAGRLSQSTSEAWEILDNKLFINNAEHGVTL